MGTRSPQEIWEAALGELQIQISKPNYRTWFQNTTGVSFEDNQFVVGVPNAFVAEYLDKTQRSLIEKTLIGLTNADIQVVFQVDGNHFDPPPAGRARLTNPPARAVPSPRLNPNYVFETFIEGNNNRLARAAALAVAENPGHTYNPLFIYGGVGLGKTHLLHAIAHVALAKRIPVVCTSAEQFTNEFVTALRQGRAEEFRNKYRNVGMLLIDDIHFITGKEQTEESFFHTFNELHNAHRQMVITSDRPPKEMPRLAERLRSRFEWGLLVDIQPPDFETRLAILQAKAAQKEAVVGTEVLEYISQQIRHNIRELEGSLNRVVAYAKLLQTLPTVELAARALKDIAKVERAGITPTRLIEAAADSFQLSVQDLLGRKRDKETVTARRLTMYLLRQETHYSLAQIGELLGGRDAAAVTHACQRIATDLSKDPYLRRKLHEIQQKIAEAG